MCKPPTSGLPRRTLRGFGLWSTTLVSPKTARQYKGLCMQHQVTLARHSHLRVSPTLLKTLLSFASKDAHPMT
jgi:hypothetical protein